MNYSLLRYAGGKTKAVNALKNYIPAGTKEVCSPFFGGGSFEIYLALNGVKVHGYDNFKPLICFWKAVLNDRDRLVSVIKQYFPLSKEMFYTLQKEIHLISDETVVGGIFFVLNRCSFSGTGLSGGMSPNHPRFTLRQIESVNNFIAKFEIDQCSFEDSIIKHSCLVYADPPYLINQALYGSKGNMHKGFNHVGLADILNKRGNFILSYNDSDEIKEMYSTHQFFYPSWKYGMSKDKNSREILILSNDLDGINI